MLQPFHFLLDDELTGDQWVQILIACGVLVVLLIAGFVVVTMVRRRMDTPDESAGSGFSLSDLRRLYQDGEMTAEEFEKAKVMVVQAAKRAAERAEARRAAGKGPDKPKRLF